MKKRARKNQIIITSLAILIAVAGYLNYTEREIAKQTNSVESTTKEGDTEQNSGNSLNPVNVEAQKEYEQDDLLQSTGDIQSMDGEGISEAPTEAAANTVVSESAGESEKEEINESEQTTTSMPGEAVLTSMSTFSANARLSREQVRSQNKETLMNALKVEGLTDAQKEHLTNQMIELTRRAQLENDVETLLAAKGYGDTVVSIGDTQVEVVVSTTAVSDIHRVQIEDVVKRKTGKETQDIIITPIKDEN